MGPRTHAATTDPARAIQSPPIQLGRARRMGSSGRSGISAGEGTTRGWAGRCGAERGSGPAARVPSPGRARVNGSSRKSGTIWGSLRRSSSILRMKLSAASAGEIAGSSARESPSMLVSPAPPSATGGSGLSHRGSPTSGSRKRRTMGWASAGAHSPVRASKTWSWGRITPERTNSEKISSVRGSISCPSRVRMRNRASMAPATPPESTASGCARARDDGAGDGAHTSDAWGERSVQVLAGQEGALPYAASDVASGGPASSPGGGGG